jgi:two-component system response regulator HydG
MGDPKSKELKLPAQFDTPFGGVAPSPGLEAGRSIREVERELIELTLAHFAGDKRAAAETLGISLNTLYNRLNTYRNPHAP